jgi:hypothetical protein
MDMNKENNQTVSTIGPLLLMSFLFIAIISNITFKSRLRKFLIVLSFIVILWLSVMASEHVSRSILVKRVEVSG